MVSIKNNEEVTCLHEAVKSRRLDVAKLLIENGACVNDLDLDNENCLHLAASNTDYDMIEYLLNETEVDTQAKNRDEMNPLCLLVALSRNQSEDVVSRCFFLMLERTYDKNPITNCYTIADIFQPALLACVYGHSEIIKWIIFNIYSVNNSKYELIKQLNMNSDDAEPEYIYYILIFLHDEITRYDKFSFPRFSEIDYYFAIRSVLYNIDRQLLTPDGDIALIKKLLNELETIGFNLRASEFEENFANLMKEKCSTGPFNEVELSQFSDLFNYLSDKGFNLNISIKGFLHNIAIHTPELPIVLPSLMAVLKLLLPFSTNICHQRELWQLIKDTKNLNPEIDIISSWLIQNFGNSVSNSVMGLQVVYSLKQLCRDQIRSQLLEVHPKIFRDHQALLGLQIPDDLLKFVLFKT